MVKPRTMLRTMLNGLVEKCIKREERETIISSKERHTLLNKRRCRREQKRGCKPRASIQGIVHNQSTEKRKIPCPISRNRYRLKSTQSVVLTTPDKTRSRLPARYRRRVRKFHATTGEISESWLQVQLQDQTRAHAGKPGISPGISRSCARSGPSSRIEGSGMQGMDTGGGAARA